MEKPIIIKHPVYGHVEFNNMSIRQKDVLNYLAKLIKKRKLVIHKKTVNGKKS